MKRLSLAATVLAALAIGCYVPGAHAEETRKQEIRILVGFAAGGTVDAIARVIAAKLKDLTGATVIVENKPGAGGVVATKALAASPADGSVLLLAGVTSIAIDQQSVAPVSLVSEFEYGLAVASHLEVRNLKELVAWMKAQPLGASFGSPGAGSLPHFFGLRFASVAGVEVTHVPFKGGGPLVTDLIGGHVPVGVSPITDYIEPHRAGRLRLIATSGAARSPATPDVPTFSEQGFAEAQATFYFAFWAPPQTPAATLARRSQEIQQVLRRDDVRGQLLQLGQRPVAGSPEEVDRIRAAEAERWTPVVKASGFLAER